MIYYNLKIEPVDTNSNSIHVSDVYEDHISYYPKNNYIEYSQIKMAWKNKEIAKNKAVAILQKQIDNHDAQILKLFEQINKIKAL